MFESLGNAGFDLHVGNHAAAILKEDFGPWMTELETILLRFSIPPHELIASGGGEAASTQRLRNDLHQSG